MKTAVHWNLSNPVHQGTREVCRIVQDVRILVNRNTLGELFFVGWQWMLENSGVWLHKFHCICSFFMMFLKGLTFKPTFSIRMMFFIAWSLVSLMVRNSISSTSLEVFKWNRIFYLLPHMLRLWDRWYKLILKFKKKTSEYLGDIDLRP